MEVVNKLEIEKFHKNFLKNIPEKYRKYYKPSPIQK